MTITPEPRADGWTDARQRRFLETLAAEGSVRRACAAVAISREAAYAFRQRAGGAAFALGWEAAILIARATLVDTVMERVIDGQQDVTVFDPETRERRRDWHDNRLAMSLLGRLDRRADAHDAPGADARLVAHDWDAFLDLVSGGRGVEGAAQFLAARQPPAVDGDAADDDDIKQCQLRMRRDHPERVIECAADGFAVWHDCEDGGLYTDLPPPDGFDGFEAWSFGDRHYRRVLSRDEAMLWNASRAVELRALSARGVAARDEVFAGMRGRALASGLDPDAFVADAEDTDELGDRMAQDAA